jgi:hypothetical protein
MLTFGGLEVCGLLFSGGDAKIKGTRRVSDRETRRHMTRPGIRYIHHLSLHLLSTQDLL